MPKAKSSLSELLYEVRRVEQSREILTHDKIEKIYKSLMKDLNEFLSEYYVKYADDEGKLTVAILQEKARYAKFLEELAKNADSISPKIKTEIMGLVEDTYTSCYKGMINAFNNAGDTIQGAKTAKGLSARPEVIKQALGNNISKLTLPRVLEKHRQEMVYDIQQTLNIGLMTGERYETMSRKLQERLDVSAGKANNIVRTESHRNIEAGNSDAAKAISKGLDGSDLVYTATWRNMGDERVRPYKRVHTSKGWKTVKSNTTANHVQMEGKVIKVGDKFELEPGVYAECPGQSGTARNDCNCRCYLEYKLMTKEEFAKATGKKADAKSVEKSVENVENIDFDKLKLAGIDDDYLPDVESTFRGMMKDYPVKGLTVKTSSRQDEFGHFSGQIKGRKINGEYCGVWSNEICINKNYNKSKSISAKMHKDNYGERMSKLADAKRCDLATIPHEYGHAIDTAYVLAKDGKLRAFAERYKTPQKVTRADVDAINNFNRAISTSDKRLSKEIYTELQKEYGLTDAETMMRIGYEYGSYAGGSVSEFLAEAVANMRILDEKEKTAFMKSFEKIFNRKFAEVFGG